VESSCDFGIEPTGSMKCWETIEWLTSSGHSISVQLHIVSYKYGDLALQVGGVSRNGTIKYGLSPAGLKTWAVLWSERAL
jgi:hypothetical protein